MDPTDLLYLHAMLAATVREQEKEISKLKQRISELCSSMETTDKGGPSDD